MIHLGYSLASVVLRRLPQRATDPFLRLLCDGYVLAHPGRARVVDRNLARIWEETRREGTPPRAKETYRAFARAVHAFLVEPPADRAPVVRLSDRARESLHLARRSGRGAVVVSGHFGPWERALQWLAGELGGVEALAAPHRFPAIDRFFVAQRARGGVRTLCSSRPVRSALRSLASGGWIAALADRPRPARARVAEEASAGALVPLDPGPLLLARRARAIVIPGAATLGHDGTLDVEFDTPFVLRPGPGGIELAQGLARLQGFFDAYVRAYPTQWFAWRAAFPGATGR